MKGFNDFLYHVCALVICFSLCNNLIGGFRGIGFAREDTGLTGLVKVCPRFCSSTQFSSEIICFALSFTQV